MKKKIEKQVHDNLQYFLDEYDVESEIKRLTSKKALDDEIKKQIKENISMSINDSFMKAFSKNNKLIDAFANNKLRSLLDELGVLN